MVLPRRKKLPYAKNADGIIAASVVLVIVAAAIITLVTGWMFPVGGSNGIPHFW
jgi:hypothetical protein